MTINITLFVQVINFSIAYLIMRRLLINPYLHTKRHYEQQQEAIDQSYAQEHAHLEHAKQHKEKQWLESLNQLARHLPTKTNIPSLSTPIMQPNVLRIDDEEINKAAMSIRRIILNKVT